MSVQMNAWFASEPVRIFWSREAFTVDRTRTPICVSRSLFAVTSRIFWVAKNKKINNNKRRLLKEYLALENGEKF